VYLSLFACSSAARKNVTYMLPNPLPPADHVRVVTTPHGDVFVTEKRKLPCVEYIARGMQYPPVRILAFYAM